MEETRPLRRNSMDTRKNPFAKQEDITRMKKKFVNIWAGKKLTAIGCSERHQDPRHLAEMDEYTTHIKMGATRSRVEALENKMMSVICSMRAKGEKLSNDEMANMLNNPTEYEELLQDYEM